MLKNKIVSDIPLNYSADNESSTQFIKFLVDNIDTDKIIFKGNVIKKMKLKDLKEISVLFVFKYNNEDKRLFQRCLVTKEIFKFLSNIFDQFNSDWYTTNLCIEIDLALRKYILSIEKLNSFDYRESYDNKIEMYSVWLNKNLNLGLNFTNVGEVTDIMHRKFISSTTNNIYSAIYSVIHNFLRKH